MAGNAANSRWQLFRLLGEPVRLRMLASAARQELSLGELADALAESLPNVSRHAAQLRQAGLLDERRLGTRTFVRFAARNTGDALIDDALSVGQALCEEAGVFQRIEEAVRKRDGRTRELLSQGEPRHARGIAPEIPLYLAAMRELVAARELVVAVAPGSGALLDVLAPLFRRVVALEPAGATRPSPAERHAELRGYDNVAFVYADARDEKLQSGTADVLVAAAHDAPLRLVHCLKTGGRLIVIDSDARARFETDLEGLERVSVEELDARRILGRPDAAAWRVLSAVRARA